MSEPCPICQWEDGSHNSGCVIVALRAENAALRAVAEAVIRGEHFWAHNPIASCHFPGCAALAALDRACPGWRER